MSPDKSGVVGPVPLRGFDQLVTPMKAEQVVDRIHAAVRSRQGLTIANLNLHGLYMSETDARFAEYTERADLNLIDGWPILRLARGPRIPADYRIGSTDWLDVLLNKGGITVAAIGGTPKSSATTAALLNSSYDVKWIGLHGFDLDARKADISSAIHEADVVLVGLGMPHQEHWILQNSDQLSSKVVANVGGCIDYYSGEQSLAPRWMGRFGIEWLYRLSRDPFRLAQRYLVEPWKLGWHVVRRKAFKALRRHQ